jgi:hypothetical protein
MTDKQLLETYEEQFNTGHLLTESHVLVLMGYARGDARQMLKEQLPTEEDIEMEMMEEDRSGNADFRIGYRSGSGMILRFLKKLL